MLTTLLTIDISNPTKLSSETIISSTVATTFNVKQGTNEKENFAIKKGLLWQQRDRLFSRWKERYFILTKDYLACFKKSSKIASSDMGGFILKLSLVDVDGVEWIDKKDGGIISISSLTEGRFFLRSKSDMDEWLRVILETIGDSKGRREALRSSVSRDSIHAAAAAADASASSTSSDSSSLLYRSDKVGVHYTHSDCSELGYRLQGSSSDLIRGSIGLTRRIADDHVVHHLLHHRQRSSASSSGADSCRFSLPKDVEGDTSMSAGPSPPSSSCSTASRTYLSPTSTAGVPMGHKRCHSHGRPPPRLQEPIIIYPNDRISPRVDRSYSDAHQLEAVARRRIRGSDRKCIQTRPEMHRELGSIVQQQQQQQNE